MNTKTTDAILDALLNKKITAAQARAYFKLLAKPNVQIVKGRLDASTMKNNTIYIIR